MNLLARNALIALGITLLILATVVYAVNYLNQVRVAELRDIEDQLATDTLSLETQFALLEEAPCEDLGGGTVLSPELGGLGDRLAATEERLGTDDPEVLRLKDRYTLLQIRDYLLTKRLARECSLDPVVVLYFYSNQEGECEDCDRAGYALSYLRQTYPSVRVYSFDYHLDLSALRTLIAMERVEPSFPAFVVDGARVYGFENLEEFSEVFPAELFEEAATSTEVS